MAGAVCARPLAGRDFSSHEHQAALSRGQCGPHAPPEAGPHDRPARNQVSLNSLTRNFEVDPRVNESPAMRDGGAGRAFTLAVTCSA